MDVELFDQRLAQVISEQEYVDLKAKAEKLYGRLEKKAPMAMLGDLFELMLLFRSVEKRLLDDRLGRPNTDWAQGSMATLD